MAFHWRIGVGEVRETKAVFLQMGFIDEDWNLVNWNKRQYVSDSSTYRVRKHRQGKKQSETLQTPDVKTDVEGSVTQNVTRNAECSADAMQSVSVAEAEKRQRTLARESAKAAAAETAAAAKALALTTAKATALKALMLSLPVWIDREAWAAYLEMREALRKPMTSGAYHQIIANLQGFEAKGLSSTEALNNSVENGWTGVFEPKPTGGPTNGTKRTTGLSDTLQRMLQSETQSQGVDSGLSLDSGGDDEARDNGQSGDGLRGVSAPVEPKPARPSLFPRAERKQVLSRPGLTPSI
jgi:hypothetical protein